MKIKRILIFLLKIEKKYNKSGRVKWSIQYNNHSISILIFNNFEKSVKSNFNRYTNDSCNRYLNVHAIFQPLADDLKFAYNLYSNIPVSHYGINN